MLVLNEVYLLQPKYYGGDYNRMLEILLECKNTGTTFLVGGRNIEGVFKVCIHCSFHLLHPLENKVWSYTSLFILKVLEDLDIPVELREMFNSIPEEKFRMDISSTDIRKKQGPWCIKHAVLLIYSPRHPVLKYSNMSNRLLGCYILEQGE